MKKISVIVPTYNCSAYIAEAINSILTQTRPAHEIIIIDDGSTDNTELIVSQFNDPRINYIKQNNGGVSRARNHGINLAKGDYIAFLDADDRWHPTMLAEQSTVLDAHLDVALCFTNFIRFNEPSGEMLSEQFVFYPELAHIDCLPSSLEGAAIIADDGFCALVNFGEIPGFTQAILFRRSAIANIRFNEQLKICEDAEFVLRIVVNRKVAFNNHVLLEVRRHEANTTKDTNQIAIDKLNAILALHSLQQLTQQQQASLGERTIKAYLDAAICTAKKGEFSNAVKLYIAAIKINGHTARKLKGLIRMLMAIR